MKSLRTGSIAGRGARTIIGRSRAWFRRCFAAAALTLRSGGGAFLARGDAQPLDPPWIGIKHFDLVIARARYHFTADRQPANMGDEITAERLDLFASLACDEVLAYHGANVIESGARVGDKGTVSLPHDRGRFVAVVLVIDVADDLFDDVLDRDQPIGAAIFIHHQRQMDS